MREREAKLTENKGGTRETNKMYHFIIILSYSALLVECQNF